MRMLTESMSPPQLSGDEDGGADGDSVAVTDGWYFLTGGIFS